jgi:hypothetical protein
LDFFIEGNVEKWGGGYWQSYEKAYNWRIEEIPAYLVSRPRINGNQFDIIYRSTINENNLKNQSGALHRNNPNIPNFYPSVTLSSVEIKSQNTVNIPNRLNTKKLTAGLLRDYFGVEHAKESITISSQDINKLTPILNMQQAQSGSFTQIGLGGGFSIIMPNLGLIPLQTTYRIYHDAKAHLAFEFLGERAYLGSISSYELRNFNLSPNFLFVNNSGRLLHTYLNSQYRDYYQRALNSFDDYANFKRSYLDPLAPHVFKIEIPAYKFTSSYSYQFSH